MNSPPVTITIDWSRSALLPCGAEVNVDYSVTATLAEDETEILSVKHVESSYSSALEVDEFDAALSNRDRKRLNAALERAAAAKTERAA